jgi:hypothetical protein
MKIEAESVVLSGEMIIYNAGSFREKIKSLPDGNYLWTVKKIYRKASHDQFGWLFAGIYPAFLDAAIGAGWEIPGENREEQIEYIDAFCKQMFAKKTILNKNTGEYVDVPDLKRHFKTYDMMAYVEAIRNHCAEFFGVEIEEPKYPNYENNDDN